MIKKEDTKAITDIANENWDYTCALIDAQKLGRSELEKKYAAYYNLAIKFRGTSNQLEDENEKLKSKIKKLNGIVAMASNLGELESYWDLLEKYKKLKADYESEQKLRKEYQEQSWESKKELQEAEEELQWWIGCKTTDFRVKYGADKVVIYRDFEGERSRA